MTGGMDLLTTVAEAGGITGVVAVVILVIVRMIQRKGCTCKLYGCTGHPLVDIDCEEGAATKRYLPKISRDSVLQTVPETATFDVDVSKRT